MPKYQPGRYVANITNQQIGKNRNGNSQIILSFRISGRVDPSNPMSILDCEEGDRSIFQVITDKTIDFVVEDLRSAGFKGESFGQISLNHPNCCDMRGEEIEVTCSHEEYQGRMVEKWRLYRESSGPRVEEMDRSEFRELDAMFGAKLKASPPKKEPPKTDEQPVGGRDQDLPF